jgi:hypothetical protein
MNFCVAANIDEKAGIYIFVHPFAELAATSLQEAGFQIIHAEISDR